MAYDVAMVLLAVFLLVQGLRYVGEAGARRFDALAEDRARAVHESFRVDPRWWSGVVVVGAGVGTGLNLWRGSVLDACLTGAAVAMGVASLPVRRAARDVVVRQMARRGLEPDPSVPGLPPSRTRTRRVRQLGVAALACYLASAILLVASEETGNAWFTRIGVALFLLAFVALVGLAWAAAWKFADEEQAPPRSQA